ncbi:MAG: outer membrane beta-barrel protein [Ferrovum sp.]|nr:outer membrane beta-barrel protein [Ferrovum sp.]
MQYITGPWTLIGGKFNSMSGVEVPNSVSDTNITRSILYGHSPFTHTGVRAVNALSDATTLTMGVNNGWDQVSGMTVSKTGEFAINQAFTKDTSLLFDVYDGAESVPTSLGWAGAIPVGTITNMYSANAGTPLSGIRSGNRTLLDMVFTSNLTPSLTFILNADHSSQQNAVIGPLGQVGTEMYWGWAGYLNYQIDDQYRVSFRAEQLHDLSGVAVAAPGTAPGSNTVREATLTLGYAPVKDFELRAELRGDSADKGVFAASNGILYQNMVTYGLQGIYKF